MTGRLTEVKDQTYNQGRSAVDRAEARDYGQTMPRALAKLRRAERRIASVEKAKRSIRKTPHPSADIGLFNSIPALMRQVHRGLSRGMEQRTARYGISIGTWYFLRVLWQDDGLTQSELSDRIGIVGPTTVMAINRMVRDGLAVRSTDPDDRRKGRIYLTGRAKRLKKKLLNEASNFVDQALASIPERDIRQLRMTLRRIAINLKPYLSAAVFSGIIAELKR